MRRSMKGNSIERERVRPSGAAPTRLYQRDTRRGSAIAVAALFALVGATAGWAQAPAEAPRSLPDTTIAPASSAAPASAAEPETAPAGDIEGPDITAPETPETAPPAPSATAPSAHHPRVHHVMPMKPGTYTGPVEEGSAMLALKADSWAYALPAASSHHIERVHAGKYVNVTGSTRHYLRVKLKSGETAYVPIKAVELARPADKVFRLTKDTPVLSAPSHFGKKLAEVHAGHDVHVVGTSMNYMKIRMKDGLEGYIAMTALE